MLHLANEQMIYRVATGGAGENPGEQSLVVALSLADQKIRAGVPGASESLAARHPGRGGRPRRAGDPAAARLGGLVLACRLPRPGVRLAPGRAGAGRPAASRDVVMGP